DITAQHIEQTEREQESALLADILSHIPHSVFWKDKNSVYRGCNERFLRDANLKSRSQVIGKNDFEMPWGKTDAENYRLYDAKLIASGKSELNIEETQSRADGSVAHVITSKVPLRNRKGEITGILGIYMDISELREAQMQLEDQQRRMGAASKMAALGVLAAGIAHEINNPLAIISATCSYLEEASAQGTLGRPELENGLAVVDKTVNRIAKIVRGLKAFTRNQSKEQMRETPLAKILDESFELCAERMRACDIQFIRPELPEAEMLFCRESEISQVLINLLNNSVDAIASLDEKWIKVGLAVEEGFSVLTITDSGPGIPEAVRAKIFEPFFTTKDVGKGTGLGLSISLGLIASHGGTFSYNSASPHTEFVLALPRAKKEPQKERAA
ncbi:MAG: PAS domain S-box protein, partial [Proteobacteria bacterium]